MKTLFGWIMGRGPTLADRLAALGLGAVLLIWAAFEPGRVLQGLWLLPVFGAVVSSDTLLAIKQGFQALFLASFEAVKTMWEKAAMRTTSTGQEEVYNWLGRVPNMKEWVDQRVLEGLLAQDFTIKNKHWEATIEVDRNAIEDDRIGMYTPRVQELGEEARRHPDELVSDLLNNGGAQLAYDGQFFFDTDHAEGASGSQSNIVTGTGTTVAQITADFRSARSKLRSLKDDRGKPYLRGDVKLLVVARPELEGILEELANAAFIANTENVLKGAFDLWINPYLDGATGKVNDYYVLHVGAPVRPLIVQMRRNPEFVSLTDPGSEHVFKHRTFLFGVDGRYNAGYGLWQYAVKVDNA